MNKRNLEKLLACIDSESNLLIKDRQKLYKDKFKSCNYKLYKYYSLDNEYTLTNIGDDILYLNFPSQFNDPFDCYLGYSLDDCLKDVSLTLILEDLFEMQDTTLECFTKFILGEDLNKFEIKFLNQKIEEYAIGFEEKNIVNWTKKPMTDKFKLICCLLHDDWQNMSEAYLNCARKMVDLQENVRKAIDENFLVTCFSERYDNELMWAHYANKHTGVCVEYDFSLIGDDEELNYLALLTFPVLYSKVRPKIPISIERKAPLHYMVREGKYTTTDKYKFLLTKSSSWRYEREWRLILPECETHLKKMPIISKIFLGVNISEQAENKIRAIAKEKGVPIQKMRLDFKDYKLL